MSEPRPSSSKKPGLAPRHFVAVILLMVVAMLAILTSAAFSSFVCSGDSSHCASSTDKDGVYEGIVVTEDDRPYRGRPVLVDFASRDEFRDEPRVRFTTDDSGHLCMVWARESAYPTLYTPDGAPLFARYQGYRYAGEGPAAALGGWQALEGRPVPAGCQTTDASIPWYDAFHASHSWQAWLLVAIPAAAILILLLAAIRYDGPESRRLLRAAWLLLLVEAIAFPVLWGFI